MIALALALAGVPGAAADDPPFAETVVRVPTEGSALALRDLTGDGGLELLRVDGRGLAVFALREDGELERNPFAEMPWPEGRVGWDLSDLDGDGVSEIALVLAEGTVRVHRPVVGPPGEGSFGDGTAVAEVRTYLPAGATRLRFARDVDGDGRQDLVLPGPGEHRVLLARDGGWAPPIEVAYELDAHYDVGDPESLSSAFGQRVRVPWFRIEDVDGDGRDDLISETSERVAFHLAAPELSSEPTWTLDLEALRDELPDGPRVDFDDLFSALDSRVTWRIADVDGRAPRDLVVTLGAKVRVYLGGALAGPAGDPDQVLKSSGNVLWTFVRQVEGDPLPDLQIARAERVSLARVLRSLLLPSALDFDLFTYRNEDGTFARRPTRTNRVTLEIPRLLSFLDDAEGLEEQIEAQFDILAQRLCRTPGAPREGDDVADVAGGELVVLPGCAPAPSFVEQLVDGELAPERFVEAFFLEDLDARGDGATRTIDLGDVRTYDFAPGAALRRACEGVEPRARHPLAVKADEVTAILVRDLDGDGREDVIVVGEQEEEWVVQMLVWRSQE